MLHDLMCKILHMDHVCKQIVNDYGLIQMNEKEYL